MTDKEFYTIFGDALVSNDRDAFASDWALSPIFGEPEGDELLKLSAQCGAIWDVAHMSIRDLMDKAQLRQCDLSRKFCIPLRTVQHWASGERSCPQWVILGFARQLGLIDPMLTSPHSM